MKVGDKISYGEPKPSKFVNGKWDYETVDYQVTIMAIAGNYAMVRRKGCVPFVESINNLTKWMYTL